MLKRPDFADIIDIVDPVLGEFLDPHSLGHYVQAGKMCAAGTRVWKTADVELRKRWRTLGRISFRDEQCCQRLTLPWQIDQYSWHEIKLQQEIWAGQGPQIFWTGGSKVVCIAGAVYPDQIGGATPLPLHDVCIVDIVTGEVEPIGVEGPAHPQIMGCAAAYRRETEEVIFFGGGAPCDPQSLNNIASSLNLRTRKWTRLKCQGELPYARQGLHGTIYEDKFYIFGGRKLYGTCLNDTWALDLETLEWHEIATAGTPPSPRVWYAACHGPYGQWCVIGGSMWDFTVPSEEEVQAYRDLFLFNFLTHTWERIETPTSPEWCTSPTLVPLASRQLLFFGGCKVQLVNTDALHLRPMTSWREWYPSMTSNVRVFDRRTNEWRPLAPPVRNRRKTRDMEEDDISEMSEEDDDPMHLNDVLRRSHFASCSVINEQGDKVLVFGGSRYFTGEYFHDMFVFHQSPPAVPSPDESTERRYIMAHTRGQLGHLRALVRHGYLPAEQYEEIVQRLNPP